MYAAAVNMSLKLDLAWHASEEVEDVAIAVKRSTCANLDVAMQELEQSLRAAVPQWMALVALLGLTAVVFLLDAYHAFYLINISRGLTRNTARPIYKPPRAKTVDDLGLDPADNIAKIADTDAASVPAKMTKRRSKAENIKAATKACPSTAPEQPASTTPLGVSTDFCEDFFHDKSRFEKPSTSAVSDAPPGRQRSAMLQVKFAWGSTNAFSKVASIQHAVDYEKRRQSARLMFSRVAMSRPASSSRVTPNGTTPNGSERSAGAGTPVAPPSFMGRSRAPRGSNRKVTPSTAGGVPYQR